MKQRGKKEQDTGEAIRFAANSTASGSMPHDQEIKTLTSELYNLQGGEPRGTPK